MKTVKFSNAFLLLASFFLLQSSTAPFAEGVMSGDEWKILGTTTVKESLDRDEVNVTFKKGMFTTVKIKVKNAPLDMKKVVIHFRNGDTQDLMIKNNFSKGSESRAIDLHGGKKIISKVVFWYNKGHWASHTPVVVLLGK